MKKIHHLKTEWVSVCVSVCAWWISMNGQIIPGDYPIVFLLEMPIPTFDIFFLHAMILLFTLYIKPVYNLYHSPPPHPTPSSYLYCLKNGLKCVHVVGSYSRMCHVQKLLYETHKYCNRNDDVLQFHVWAEVRVAGCVANVHRLVCMEHLHNIFEVMGW